MRMKSRLGLYGVNYPEVAGEVRVGDVGVRDVEIACFALVFAPGVAELEEARGIVVADGENGVPAGHGVSGRRHGDDGWGGVRVCPTVVESEAEGKRESGYDCTLKLREALLQRLIPGDGVVGGRVIGRLRGLRCRLRSDGKGSAVVERLGRDVGPSGLCADSCLVEGIGAVAQVGPAVEGYSAFGDALVIVEKKARGDESWIFTALDTVVLHCGGKRVGSTGAQLFLIVDDEVDAGILYGEVESAGQRAHNAAGRAEILVPLIGIIGFPAKSTDNARHRSTPSSVHVGNCFVRSLFVWSNAEQHTGSAEGPQQIRTQKSKGFDSHVSEQEALPDVKVWGFGLQSRRRNCDVELIASYAGPASLC